jgi:uncharacterized protein (TIGR01777 family)
MGNAKKILITGASGLIGTRLTELLQQKQYEVVHVGRGKKKGPVTSFSWDINKNFIEPGALTGVDAIVHLAGAGVVDKRWTEKRKEEILDSRTQSTRLLYDELKKGHHNIKCFVCASGVGYYGVEDNGLMLDESDEPGDDFLADVTRQWEAEADRISELMRVCKLRIGFVLSDRAGALPELARPIKWLIGSPLGTGKQFINWIHIDDLCGVFIKMIEDDSMHGPYNGVAPGPVTNREFTKAVASVLEKPLFLPAVPAFVLNILIGEMAYIILKGGAVSGEKIRQAGYVFKFTDPKEALVDLLKK